MIATSLLTAILLGAPDPALLAPAVFAGSDSLEDLLRRERERRDAEAEKLRPEVDARIAALDALGRGNARRQDEDEDDAERARLAGELLALGPAVPPLLLPYLDPGFVPPGAGELASSSSRRQRAAVVRDTLLALPQASITATLLQLARSGNDWQRAGALAVLGDSEERDRVVPVLLGLLRAEESAGVRLAALRACARQGGQEELAAIAEVLHDPDDALVAGALTALATAGSPTARSLVLALALDPERAHRFVPEIVRYFEGIPELVDDEVVLALLELAAHELTDDDDRVALLIAAPSFDPGWEPAWARTLDPLTKKREGVVRDSALICLARLGSTIAKRDVMRTYDDLVDQDPNWSNAYVQRARVLGALEEYRLAIKDWKKALDLSRAPVEKKKLIWVELARAHALDGNLREAQKTLEGSPLTSSEIRSLKDDPAFAAMVAHSRYGKLFD